MGFWRGRGKEPPEKPAPVQLRPADRHPFSLIDGYVPLHQPEFSLYRAIREAVPVVDAAVLKLVRLARRRGGDLPGQGGRAGAEPLSPHGAGGVESKGHPGFPGQLPGLPAHLWTGGGRDCPQPGWAGHCRCAVRAGVGCPG